MNSQPAAESRALVLILKTRAAVWVPGVLASGNDIKTVEFLTPNSLEYGTS